MKKFFSLISLFLIATSMSATSVLTLHQKDGQVFHYAFTDKPVISFTETDLVMSTTQTEVQYPLSSVSEFTFDDIDTSVKPVKSESNVSYAEGTVTITGMTPSASVTLSAIDGKVLDSFKADASGNLSFSTNSLQQGVYIIKYDSSTCKILKK